jgi:hypothetical protein
MPSGRRESELPAQVHTIRCSPASISAELVPHSFPLDGPMSRWLAACLPLSPTPGNIPGICGLDPSLLRQLNLPGASHGLSTNPPGLV